MAERNIAQSREKPPVETVTQETPTVNTERLAVSSTGNRINLNELPHHDPEVLHAAEEAAEAREAAIGKHMQFFATKQANPEYDQLTVRPEMRRKYGVGDDVTLVWKRNPARNLWNNIQGNQSLDHWLASVPGGHVVTYKNEKGERTEVTSGDLILCGYDNVLDEAYQRHQRAEQEKFLNSTQSGGDFSVESRDAEFTIPRYRETQEELTAMREEALKELYSSGIIGEWAGQDMEIVLNALGDEKVERITNEHRGGYTTILETAESIAAKADSASRGGGSKIVSIPKNVRPRNFAGAKK